MTTSADSIFELLSASGFRRTRISILILRPMVLVKGWLTGIRDALFIGLFLFSAELRGCLVRRSFAVGHNRTICSAQNYIQLESSVNSANLRKKIAKISQYAHAS